ncbi:hypothetical protein CYY_002577 [Polysphondylium violaceum]|uniref:C2H2-type domain-containing protein n=1 Tax=Polysphondylium violaceum TaxID=133409 RepID=A0A8J4PZ41_9MYCE|nr:hypothetical protein CYY_002577 [Polysphondylium violaceum]
MSFAYPCRHQKCIKRDKESHNGYKDNYARLRHEKTFHALCGSECFVEHKTLSERNLVCTSCNRYFQNTEKLNQHNKTIHNLDKNNSSLPSPSHSSSSSPLSHSLPNSNSSGDGHSSFSHNHNSQEGDINPPLLNIYSTHINHELLSSFLKGLNKDKKDEFFVIFPSLKKEMKSS